MSTSTDGLAAFQWDLADRLGKSLRVADMSAQDMADYLEVHRNTVGSWLRGATTPGGMVLKLWAMRVGAPYEWLRYGSEPSGQPPGPDGGPAKVPDGSGADSGAPREARTPDLRIIRPVVCPQYSEKIPA